MRNENTAQYSDFLLELYDDASRYKPDELRLRVLGNLQRVIPFDFGVWGGGWADGRLVTDLTVLNHSDRILGDWEAIADQDAFCDLTLNRLGQTARFDDVPDYRESLAYNEHWRRFDVSQMMATIVGARPDGYVSFVGLCSEERPAVFSDEVRSLKQMLMPHLSQALRMNRELWTGRMAMAHEAIALVDRDGCVLSMHGPFGDMAEDEWGIRSGRLPARVMDALRRTGRWRGETLDARLSRFDSAYFVYLTVHPRLSRLSPRERQVAELFAQGLTHRQVARRMGTSPSTVRNQVAKIYEKLEITSKAALAALVGSTQP